MKTKWIRLTNKCVDILQNKWMKWSLVIVWMLLIFAMSNLDAVKSWYITGKTLGVVEQTTDEVKDLTYEEEITYYSQKEDSMILLRKTAHVIEYFVLCLLLFNAFVSKFRYSKAIGVGVFVSILYASFDEFHQTFIPGRTGNITDVGIDSIGVILAVLVIIALKKVNKRYKIVF